MRLDNPLGAGGHCKKMLEGIKRKDKDNYYEEKECWPPLRKASRNAYGYYVRLRALLC